MRRRVRLEPEESSSTREENTNKDEIIPVLNTISMTSSSTTGSNHLISPKYHPSTTNTTTSSGSGHQPEESDEMKRAAAKKLIERYFYQLLEGCGNPTCTNKNCASSGEVKNLTPDQAAARAIQLYSQDAQLCEVHRSKVARTHEDSVKSEDTRSNIPSSKFTSDNNENLSHDQVPQTSKSSQSCDDHITTHKSTSSSSIFPKTDAVRYQPSKSSTSLTTVTPNSRYLYIDEDEINRLIDVCHEEKSYAQIIRTLGFVFSNRDYVAASFQKKPCASIDAMLEKTPGDLKSLKKEDFRTLEGDLDKDEDSCVDKTETPDSLQHTTVDLVSLRRAITRLFEDNSAMFEMLNTAVESLASTLISDLKVTSRKNLIEEMITVFVIIFEIFGIAKIQFLDIAFPSICKAATYLPVWAQARLARIWAEHCRDSLKNYLEILQQLITLQVISSDLYRDSYVQDNEKIVNATKVMKIVYNASLLAGVLEARQRDEDFAMSNSIADDDDMFQFNSGSKILNQPAPEDALAVELGVSALECRGPFIPFEHFYNETLSDIIEMDKDYLNYKQMSSSGSPFSFMLYSFILTPATKTLSLYFDNRIRMYSERRFSIFHPSIAGQPPSPYFKLRVRRDRLIDDALVELEVVAMGNPKDLKKQLYVEFIGEQGVDEGGVSKEFFQLIVEQIFNPDYGMFIHNEELNTVWFNSTSFENDGQFTLIGIVLGLAIYNNIILAVNFPMVVYRKLMGLRGTFFDLEDLNPVLHRSLKSMLEYEGADMEDVFVQTFRITYSDIFGNTLFHDLKPNGDAILVNQENKQEFVDLYSDYLLNQSIEKQFLAFKKGFQMVTDESPLQLLFRPEEIELLVCGSKQFDFNELEAATEYEGGYTASSQTILDFWNIVHALPIESKKKLLEFTTGSDRVPVGGLSKLKMVIARNGPDCDRLPTSHTCFNVLLLPEYSSKEKLEDRLLKAINYSKGFGMI